MPTAIAQAKRPDKRRGPDFDEGLMGVALLAGPANVIMELARPGVGYGVLESRVESAYIAAATKGTEEQKAAYRSASRAQARSQTVRV